MKTRNIFSVLCIGAITVLASSCNDWLTIPPKSQLTHENFFTDKKELGQVRTAAYANFGTQKNAYMMWLWGELRSDNFVINGSVAPTFLKDMVEGHLDTLRTEYDWSDFYKAIQISNVVIDQVEPVGSKDHTFTETEMKRMKSEMRVLRALSHFYLTRAFCNVPITTHPIYSDEDIEYTPQLSQNAVLDFIIKEIDECKDDVIINLESVNDSRQFISRSTAYAILADAYMWRGAKYQGVNDIANADECYSKAVDCCQKSLKLLSQQYDNMPEHRDSKLSSLPQNWKGCYNLDQNYAPHGSLELNLDYGFNSLFSKGKFYEKYDCENIFESKCKDTSGENFAGWFTIDTEKGTTFRANGTMLFKCSEGQNYVYNAEDSLAAGFISDSYMFLPSTNKRIYDVRYIMSCAYHDSDVFRSKSEAENVKIHTDGFLLKYSSPKILVEADATGAPVYTVSNSDPEIGTFILYRAAEIMLIEAEARCLLNMDGHNNHGKGLREVRMVLNELHRRAYYTYHPYNAEDVDKPAITDAAQALQWVRNERQLELYGEGKRWFDIVRYIEQEGATPEAIRTFFSDTNKYKIGAEKVNYALNSLRTRLALYNPIKWDLVKNSGYIYKQNPYWDNISSNDSEDWK